MGEKLTFQGYSPEKCLSFPLTFEVSVSYMVLLEGKKVELLFDGYCQKYLFSYCFPVTPDFCSFLLIRSFHNSLMGIHSFLWMLASLNSCKTISSTASQSLLICSPTNLSEFISHILLDITQFGSCKTLLFQFYPG